jgi:hypothetical protein
MISNVEHIDTGVYKCTANNSAGFDYKDVSLSVIPIPSLRLNPREVTAIENSDVAIKCLVENLSTSDPYFIEWFDESGTRILEVINQTF